MIVIKALEKDYSDEFKSLWVTSALDGSEDHLVSERIYSIVGTKMIEFRKQLMESTSPKNLKTLLTLITPPKGVKRRDVPHDEDAPIDEGDELFICEGGEIPFQEQNEEEDELEQEQSDL